ncbi:hypothetical protein FQN55_002932 [Onygenales sp. PD_40]|nr:hypothetical protein FQN55_002932 [Onygenales sp. PD_40]
MLLSEHGADDDIEDGPLLPKDTFPEPDTLPPPPNSHRVDSTTSTTSSPSQNNLRIRLIISLFTIILAVETGFAMLSAPTTRIFESITCLRYYEQHDQSKIGAGGHIPEELCKNESIQGEVAIVKGYGELFDALFGVLLAVPYGLLADRYGRKPIFCLCIPGFVLNIVLTGTVMWASDVFPLRMIWLSTLSWVFGGGVVVASAMIWTMMADVTTESQRAAIFFQFGVATMGSDFISSVVSSWLMKYNPWIPMFLGWSITLIGILPAVALPETKGAFQTEKEPAHELPELSPVDNNDDEESAPFHPNGIPPNPSSPAYPDPHTHPTSLSKRLTHTLSAFRFVLHSKQLLYLLSSFLVYRLSRGTAWLLIQYISTRYNWTLADANFLISFRSALTILLFLVLLPLASWYLTKHLHMHHRAKDLALAKGSVICLFLGTLGMGLAPSISLFMGAFLLQTLGIGFVFVIRSLATTMVRRDQTARLYTFIEMLQAVGMIIASPTVTVVFTWGLGLGGGWIGLPWVVAAGLFAVTGGLVWAVRLEPTRRGEGMVGRGGGGGGGEGGITI